MEWEGQPVSVWQERWALPELYLHAATTSTNDIIKARAEAGAPAGTCAIAELQTRGRGRRERRWEAPARSSLLLSMLFRPHGHSPADLAGTIPLRVGLAVARAIDAATGASIALKWPNDIVAPDGRKVAGVLCESSLSGTGVAYTVVGIGINVLQTTDQLHDDGRNTGVSLRLLVDHPPDRGVLATEVIAELLPLAAMTASPLHPAELAEYARRDILAHKPVTADGEPVGTVDGIGPSGELRVRAGGAVRAIHAGTIRRTQ
jgi:BirA family transcriptional regulator, biotin operon repressor / biotin---[acetyl-CoA-carboxylase] ligase